MNLLRVLLRVGHGSLLPSHGRAFAVAAAWQQAGADDTPAAAGANDVRKELTPAAIVACLDKAVVGQHDAKRAVAIALRNRWWVGLGPDLGGTPW